MRPMRLNFNAPVRAQAGRGDSPEVRPAANSSRRLKRKRRRWRQRGQRTSASSRLFPELGQFTLELPAGLQGRLGPPAGQRRQLSDEGGDRRHAAAGQVRRRAVRHRGALCRTRRQPGDPALLPVTLRNVEAALQVKALAAGQVSDLQPQSDADIIAWFRKVQRYDRYQVERKLAAADSKTPLPKALEASDKDYVQSRMVSLLGGQPGVKTLDLPQPAEQRPAARSKSSAFRCRPAFMWSRSPRRNSATSLLDERHGASRTMYVRTSALVTNLGVHFKLGRENALAWVTTLDKGQPVAGRRGARVQTARASNWPAPRPTRRALRSFTGLSSEPPRCSGDDDYGNAYFVSARANDAAAWRTWPSPGATGTRASSPGASTCRPAATPEPDTRAHTIFDRTLAARRRNRVDEAPAAHANQPGLWPARAAARHAGGHARRQRPAVHAARGVAQDRHRRAERGKHLCDSARRQARRVRRAAQGPAQDQRRQPGASFSSGQFRVEEFRLPVLEGRITPADKQALVNVKAVPADVQVNYVAGGARGQPAGARVGAGARQNPELQRLRGIQLHAAARRSATTAPKARKKPAPSQDQRVIADKLPLTLDRNGAGKLTIDDVPAAKQAAGAAAGGHLRRPERRGADPAQRLDPVAGRRGGRHQDRRLGHRAARRSSSRRWRWTWPASPPPAWRWR